MEVTHRLINFKRERIMMAVIKKSSSSRFPRQWAKQRSKRQIWKSKESSATLQDVFCVLPSFSCCWPSCLSSQFHTTLPILINFTCKVLHSEGWSLLVLNFLDIRLCPSQQPCVCHLATTPSTAAQAVVAGRAVSQPSSAVTFPLAGTKKPMKENELVVGRKPSTP